MTKVMFIEPRGAYSNVFEKAMTIPLLGPVTLATIAKRAGYDASVVNENISGKVGLRELRGIDMLCLTCLTSTVKRGKEIAKLFKSLNPKGRTIIGGIHSSMTPNDVKDDFDQVIIGEGEDIILDLLAGKIKNKIIQGKPVENMDNIPIPDFRLLNGWQKMDTWPVMTPRGCPYNCNFCSVTEMFGRGYRVQSPERIIKEVSRYKKGHLFFADDHFAVDMKGKLELFRLMKEYGFNRKWSAQIRANVTKDEKFVSKMRSAGCKMVHVGFESINPESLKEMRKGQTPEDIKRSIEVLHDNGIRVHGMFMLGSDADTKKTFKKTSAFCNKMDIDYMQYTILTPLPGTEFFSKINNEGRLLHKDWNQYDGLHVVHKPKLMTPAELQQGMIDCFSDFYSYTKALRKSLELAADAAYASIKTTYTNTHFPSIRPLIMRVAGRKILKDWVEHNKGYLRYISKV